MTAAPPTLAAAAARKAVRIALTGVATEADVVRALVALHHEVAAEAIAMGVPDSARLDALARTLAVQADHVRAVAPPFGARCFDVTVDLARAHFNLLAALRRDGFFDTQPQPGA